MKTRPIHTILIANRGEIASRIIRTCRKLGIKSISIYSESDKNSLFVKEADSAVYLGKRTTTSSYLNMEKIITIAQQQQADAIHPGYGFLSENAGFATQCAEAGLIFIGPNSKAIEAMGSKSNAKEIMKEGGVPIIPGYQGDDQSTERLIKEAAMIGFPLLLKASAGGGGKGMRIVHHQKNLATSIESAKREAQSAFGNDEVIIEKYIEKGRHIEFQIFGDQHGNAIHLLERECTIQRRYQKVMEESPSPVLNEAIRLQMGEAAVKAAKALNYDNAGTVEFIFDDESNTFYFLEVNTRLQVEHPVTEEITGLDLVELQIEVAEGNPLSIKQSDVKRNGYAVEARLYAEDASNSFMPASGTIHHWKTPTVDGLRVETSVQSGSEISIYYDPMIAKLIVWGRNRATAHRKMAYVLRQLKCQGLTTNQDFLLHLFGQEAILQGNYDTQYVENHLDLKTLRVKTPKQKALVLIASMLEGWNQRSNQRTALRSIPSGWRNNPYVPQQISYLWHSKANDKVDVFYTVSAKSSFNITISETTYQVNLVSIDTPNIVFTVDGAQYKATVVKQGKQHFIHLPETGNCSIIECERFPSKIKEKTEGGYQAPMPSQIVKILVKTGQDVKAEDPLIVISSMKMENTIVAEKDGKIKEIYAAEGQNVKAGFILLEMNK